MSFSDQDTSFVETDVSLVHTDVFVTCLDKSNLSESRVKRKIKIPKQDLNSPALISLVEQHKVLYDCEFPGYHNPDNRSQAWEIIARNFHGTTAHDCLTLWTTIKKNLYQNEERLKKAKKSGAAATRHRPYVHAQRLSFLKKLKTQEDEVTQCSSLKNAIDHTILMESLDQKKRRIIYTSSPLKSQENISSTAHSSDLWSQTTLISPSEADKENVLIIDMSSNEKKRKISPSPKRSTASKKSKGSRSLKIMPTIPESADEGDEAEQNVDDPGHLPQKVTKKINRQKQLFLKREAQTAKILEKVQKDAETARMMEKSKKEATAVKMIQQTKISDCKQDIVPKLDKVLPKLNDLFVETDDTFTYFCMSLVDLLRSLPPSTSRNLRLTILSKVFEAQEALESTITSSNAQIKVKQFRDSWIVITDEMQREMDACIAGTDDLQVICEEYKNDLLLLDLKTLRPGQWLNDKVIDLYFALLTSEITKVHALSTLFFTKLQIEWESDQESIHKWTKSVDIFSYEKILIPINHKAVHWVLMVVDLRMNDIRYYDSLNIMNREYPKMFLSFLQREYFLKKGVEMDSSIVWKDTQMQVSPQGNGYDCGIFTCLHGEYEARGVPLDFTQNDMEFLRKRVMWSLMKGKIN